VLIFANFGALSPLVEWAASHRNFGIPTDNTSRERDEQPPVEDFWNWARIVPNTLRFFDNFRLPLLASAD
jgi:hypothetical protein